MSNGRTDRLIPATQAPYRETLDTGRYDVGIVGQTLLSNAWVASVRASATRQSHGIFDIGGAPGQGQPHRTARPHPGLAV